MKHKIFHSCCCLTLTCGLAWSLNFDDDSEFEEIPLRIPWPSGIVATPVTDSTGRSFKMGVVQHNVISVRTEWAGTNILRGLFDKDETSNIIRKADQYAADHGWPLRRHIDYDVRPTNDLTLPTFLEEEEWKQFIGRIEMNLYPALADRYSLNASELYINDLFLTKYEFARSDRRHLGAHKDKSPWSFVVALNDDFEGGGTYFFDSHEVWRPPAGSVVFFNGARQHGAMPITSGNRYIIAGFCEYGTNNPIETFESLYVPEYDGWAYHAGFRNGDIISRLEVCERVPVREDHMTQPEFGSAPRSDDVNPSFEVRKTMLPIPPGMSEQEWMAAAQSCEVLAPTADTVMAVRRRRKSVLVTEKKADTDESKFTGRDKQEF